MANPRVKNKFPLSMVFAGLAAATFLASWARLFPSSVVENAYSRVIFPTISHISSQIASAVPFSWLDVWICGAVGILIYSIRRRQWRPPVGAVSLFYLWFFWGWGLNYHRPPIQDRLGLETGSLQEDDMIRFAETAAAELNRLWPSASEKPLDRPSAAESAAKRVQRVIAVVDGGAGEGPFRIKRSVIAEPWYRIAGVDGMFNPFGHEALVIAGPHPFELPFLMSHELAHVHGVAHEGEANLVALLATVASDDPRFQYSGWLQVWSYLKNRPRGALDPGPLADLRAIAERLRSNQVAIAGSVQSSILDAHLKANAVPEGIRSYTGFIALAVASRPRWEEFR